MHDPKPPEEEIVDIISGKKVTPSKKYDNFSVGLILVFAALLVYNQWLLPTVLAPHSATIFNVARFWLCAAAGLLPLYWIRKGAEGSPVVEMTLPVKEVVLRKSSHNHGSDDYIGFDFMGSYQMIYGVDNGTPNVKQAAKSAAGYYIHLGLRKGPGDTYVVDSWDLVKE